LIFTGDFQPQIVGFTRRARSRVTPDAEIAVLVAHTASAAGGWVVAASDRDTVELDEETQGIDKIDRAVLDVPVVIRSCA
jgi:hypothetical protein